MSDVESEKPGVTLESRIAQARLMKDAGNSTAWIARTMGISVDSAQNLLDKSSAEGSTVDLEKRVARLEQAVVILSKRMLKDDFGTDDLHELSKSLLLKNPSTP